MNNLTTKPLRIVYGDGVLGVHHRAVSYLFSYERGGLESLRFGGQEWLYRGPKPAFWRARPITIGGMVSRAGQHNGLVLTNSVRLPILSCQSTSKPLVSQLRHKIITMMTSNLPRQ